MKWLLFLIVALAAGATGLVAASQNRLDDRKIFELVYKNMPRIVDEKSLVWKSKAAASVFEAPRKGQVEASAGEGTDELAVKVSIPNNSVTISTAASIRHGDTEGSNLRIIKYGNSSIVAIGTFPQIVSVLILDKKHNIGVLSGTSSEW